MCLCVELLQQYLGGMQKAANVQSDYNSHLQYLQSPEMKQKQRELQQQEDEWKDIEKTLGLFLSCVDVAIAILTSYILYHRIKLHVAYQLYIRIHRFIKQGKIFLKSADGSGNFCG